LMASTGESPWWNRFVAFSTRTGDRADGVSVKLTSGSLARLNDPRRADPDRDGFNQRNDFNPTGQ
jgi:hypothetical protein